MKRHYRVSEKVQVGDLNQQASLFHHDAVSFTYYDDAQFEPDFEPKLPEFASNLAQQLKETCSDSLACQYDFIQTLDPEFAKITKQEETKAMMLNTELANMQIRCPALPKPLNGRKSENRYWPGSIVRFTCNEGYRLVGYETRKCRQDGLWSWGMEAECISKLSWNDSTTFLISKLLSFPHFSNSKHFLLSASVGHRRRNLHSTPHHHHLHRIVLCLPAKRSRLSHSRAGRVSLKRRSYQ